MLLWLSLNYTRSKKIHFFGYESLKYIEQV